MSTPSSNDQVTQPAPEEPTSPAPETEVLATPEGDDFIRISRKELAKEIDRLQSEDDEFARIWSSKMGDAAKKRYQPQIDQREERIVALQKELRRRDILGMSPEEIEKQFESDKNFAIEYAELVHSEPYKPAEETVDESPIIAQSWTAFREKSLSMGLPPAVWAEIERKTVEGDYTRTQGEHWTTTMQNVQFVVMEKLLEAGKAPDPAATVNPKLVAKGPDTQSGTPGGGGKSDFPDTLSEFKKLSSDEQRRILRSEGGKDHVDKLMASPA